MNTSILLIAAFFVGILVWVLFQNVFFTIGVVMLFTYTMIFVNDSEYPR